MSTGTWYSDDTLAVRDVRYASGERLEVHAHGRTYVCFILAGGFEESAAPHDSVDACVGSVTHLPDNTPHSNHFSAAGMRCLRLEIDANRITDLGLVAPAIPWIRAGGPRASELARLYMKCSNATLTSMDIDECLTLLFDRTRLRHERRRPAWLARVRDALRDNALPPSLAHLAAIASVHPAHLTKVFREAYGTSIGDSWQTGRVARACVLLAESTLSIASIANRLGFADQSHFSRVFSARLGLSPGRYRRASMSRSGLARIVQD